MVEYVELNTKYEELTNKYSKLESDYNAIVSEKTDLENTIQNLTSFKLSVEKKEKEAMINSFYMLSDDDKKDVIENIDKYSLNDIEAKLSILCVRNKVSFNLDDDNKSDPITYNLNGALDDSTPAWVRSALAVSKSMN